MEMERQNNEIAVKVYTISTNNNKRNEDTYDINFHSQSAIIEYPHNKKLSKLIKGEKNIQHKRTVQYPTRLQEMTLKEIPTRAVGDNPIYLRHFKWYGLYLLIRNVGSGIFAMGDAFKNSGILVGFILVPLLGLVCVYSQHLLLNASKYLKENLDLDENPNFATTVGLCFATGPRKLQRLSVIMKMFVNLFLCITQFGFCCVYFVFISTNVKQIMDHYGFIYSVNLHMAVVLIPILLCCLVRNLKCLAPLSTIANVLMLIGIIITLYYTCQKPFAKVELFAGFKQLPLFFGTAVYAFEGIGLVLPLQNEMKSPRNFDKPTGVLNVGMVFVTFLYIGTGLMAYLKYGTDIHGSVTLDLAEEEVLAQAVKVIISVGILFTFALQFYIPIDIMFPIFRNYFEPLSRPVLVELIFRTTFVLITFTLSEAIPFLNLFITLVGAFSSTTIALIFPPIIDLVNASVSCRLTIWIAIKDGFILTVGILGCITGSFEAIKLIIQTFVNEQN